MTNRQHSPTRSEIISLAVAEGHDADIPSNVGSLRPTPAKPHAQPSHAPPKASAPLALDKDLEKGEERASLSTQDEELDDAAPEDDPNIVFWDGPDDPQNPLNWPASRKWGTVALVSGITFLTPLASSMFAPGVPKVMQTFHSTDDMLEGFMVSVYVLGFAFGPMSCVPPLRPINHYLRRAPGADDVVQLLRPCPRCTAGCRCITAATACLSSSALRPRWRLTWACLSRSGFSWAALAARRWCWGVGRLRI